METKYRDIADGNALGGVTAVVLVVLETKYSDIADSKQI